MTLRTHGRMPKERIGEGPFSVLVWQLEGVPAFVSRVRRPHWDEDVKEAEHSAWVLVVHEGQIKRGRYERLLFADGEEILGWLCYAIDEDDPDDETVESVSMWCQIPEVP